MIRQVKLELIRKKMKYYLYLDSKMTAMKFLCWTLLGAN
jgi:hypothetical protein